MDRNFCLRLLRLRLQESPKDELYIKDWGMLIEDNVELGFVPEKIVLHAENDVKPEESESRIEFVDEENDDCCWFEDLSEKEVETLEGLLMLK